MNSWIDSFNLSISSAALLLSVIGLWFTSVISGIDRWSRRFFMRFFIIFLLCCLSGLLEIAFQSYIVPRTVFCILLLLENLLLTLLLPMLTVYLLHCCGESPRTSKLLRAVFGLWAGSFALFVSVFLFFDGFVHITPENQYYRGPLYPFLLIPTVMIPMLNLAGTIKRRKRLSHKTFLAFLIAILPIAVALTVHLFVDFYPLVEISYVLSALAMYSLILSDQIEQDRRHQQKIILQEREIAKREREIALQQREIANQRANVMVLQMRPHFIYNTLMSIYSLCKLDPLKARQITLDFTNYLRKNFKAVASDSAILFSEELEHTHAYLAVEQARHNNMLAVDWDTTFTHFRLPPLTLQPIVENAVKHGMDPDSAPLRISVRTRHTDSGSEIIVEDTDPGFDPDDESKPHTTLNNIRQRLEMMCGGSLTITPREGGGTVVTVTIPDGAAE